MTTNGFGRCRTSPGAPGNDLRAVSVVAGPSDDLHARGQSRRGEIDRIAATEQQSAVATDLARPITVTANDASRATTKTNQVADGIQESTQRTTTLHQLIVEA